MSRTNINWCPTPPPDDFTPVVAVQLHQTLQVIAAGPCLGLKTHWLDGRSQPCCCPSPREGVCKVQLARWKGYIPCYFHNGRRVIVEVTLGAIRAVPQLLHQDITGKWIKFRRPGERRNGPVMVEVNDQMPRALNVRAYDPRPALFRMWELPEADDQGEKGGSDAPQEDF